MFNLSKSQLSLLFIALLAAWTAGCSSQGGNLNVVSTNIKDVQIDSEYQTVLYTRQESGLVTVVLVDGPVEAPRQAVTIRTIWTPMAGKTPVESDATNATIQYIIYAGPNREIAGIYSGAGYVYLYDNAGSKNVDFGMWQSNLILIDSTAGFQDRIGQASMTGKFSATRDDAKTLTLLRSMSEEISSTLGYPRVVKAGPKGPANSTENSTLTTQKNSPGGMASCGLNRGSNVVTTTLCTATTAVGPAEVPAIATAAALK